MKYLHTLFAIFALVLLGNTSVFAETPKPVIPKGNAEQCVEPTSDMRRNHMKYILHQRDKTMHKGIRTSKHSFKQCISCHVVKGDNGKPVNYKSEKHFCNSCHTYAAVKIDCFDCHASTPTKKSGKTTSKINSLTKISASGRSVE
jgi:hypothetical protein